MLNVLNTYVRGMKIEKIWQAIDRVHVCNRLRWDRESTVFNRSSRIHRKRDMLVTTYL